MESNLSRTTDCYQKIKVALKMWCQDQIGTKTITKEFGRVAQFRTSASLLTLKPLATQ